MSKQFDVIEFLANEALIDHFEIKNAINVYPIFDKCIHIYTPVGSPSRFSLHGHHGYSGPIMASDKIFPIIPSVLIENALKYSIPMTEINVEIRSQNKRCVVTVTNQATRNSDLTPHIFQNGVRAPNSGEGSGNGLFLACLTVWPARRVVDAFPHATSLRNLPDALRRPLPPIRRMLLGHSAVR